MYTRASGFLRKPTRGTEDNGCCCTVKGTNNLVVYNSGLSTEYSGHFRYNSAMDCMERANCLDLPTLGVEIWADPKLYYNNRGYDSTKIKMIQTVRKNVQVIPDTGAQICLMSISTYNKLKFRKNWLSKCEITVSGVTKMVWTS